MSPPYVPMLKNDIDTKHFDKKFTMSALESPLESFTKAEIS